MGADNGEAGAGGQRPERAFPSLLSRLLQGLRGRMNPVRESGFQQGIDSFSKVLVSEPGRSALQHRIDALRKLLKSLLALEHLAVDEEGRRRTDLQHLAGEFLVG